jgi:hypothetical protein
MRQNRTSCALAAAATGQVRAKIVKTAPGNAENLAP